MLHKYITVLVRYYRMFRHCQ